ncbi:Rz-like protein [Pantoea phage Nufs112]|nr:Rz-like protein [Pantoea phage Nufs112]
MKALLNIVAGLLLLLQSYKVDKEQKDAQEQADSISEEPADWFNDHFSGGLHKQSADEGSSGKTTIKGKDSQH